MFTKFGNADRGLYSHIHRKTVGIPPAY